MSNTANTFGTPDNVVGNMNGFFKDTWAKNLGRILPDGVILLKEIAFNPKASQAGNLFHQPVVMSMEHGITFAESTDDAFSLLPPVSAATKDAQIRGCPAVLRGVIGYTAAQRSQGSQAAFEDATKYVIKNMIDSMSKKLEIEILYGQMGYGVVNASTSSSTSFVVKLGEWAPGIWAGAENMPIEIRSSDGNTVRGENVVKAVDMDTRTITMESAMTLTADDVIWHKGAYGKEFAGIHKILSQTSGTLFNVDISKYGIFRGNTYSAGSAALSQAKLSLALTRAVEKGLDGKVLALVNPKAWTNMMTDQAALRHFDSSYSKDKATNGFSKLEFHSLNGGLIEVRPSIYVKEAYAFLLDMDSWLRVGSTELSFRMPGAGDQYVLHRPDSAGYETRLFTDQAVFTHRPGTSVLIKDIVNAAA